MEGRNCCRCGKFKVWDLYYRDRGHSTGRLSYCKECSDLVRRRDYYSKPDSWVDAYLRRHYNGFTSAQYEEMLDAQGRVCAICGRVETVRTGKGANKTFRLIVHYDHVIEAVEELLCFRCYKAVLRGE